MTPIIMTIKIEIQQVAIPHRHNNEDKTLYQKNKTFSSKTQIKTYNNITNAKNSNNTPVADFSCFVSVHGVMQHTFNTPIPGDN